MQDRMPSTACKNSQGSKTTLVATIYPDIPDKSDTIKPFNILCCQGLMMFCPTKLQNTIDALRLRTT